MIIDVGSPFQCRHLHPYSVFDINYLYALTGKGYSCLRVKPSVYYKLKKTQSRVRVWCLCSPQWHAPRALYNILLYCSPFLHRRIFELVFWLGVCRGYSVTSQGEQRS